RYDEAKTIKNGKIFTLEQDKSNDGKIDVNDLEWNYLEGDGDFNSTEIELLRNEADIIITNPPFSLFRDFLAWIVPSEKKFLIIGSMNAITYKEVFPLIKNNEMWLGNGFQAGNAYFSTPFAKEYALGVYNPETGLVKFRNICWFTNLDHGRRHQPLPLMSVEDNLKFSKHKEIKGRDTYECYDNYDAIEVPFTDAIPNNYKGVMGVPISFLDKYSPEQFKIVGLTSGREEFECTPSKKYKNPKQHNPDGKLSNGSKANTRATLKLASIPSGIYYTADNADGPLSIVYARILIQHIKR
ncbi:MAG: DNA methyltransferase, partial [Flavobacterium sp.]